jgi:8-oxo-dGTP diphosphatase
LVHLIRHADAGDRESWEGPDETRPLSAKGRRQSEALLKQFEKQRPTALLSSPYLRCRQTLEPIAVRWGMPVVNEPRLREGSPWRLALDLIEDAEPGTIMCSQGDVIGGVIEDLVRHGLIRARDARCQKASVWHLEVEHGTVVRATYTPPP